MRRSRLVINESKLAKPEKEKATGSALSDET